MKVYIGRYPESEKERKIRIRIDKWDTWNMDHTLSLMIHPMLVQLKATKHGAPCVEDCDVPPEFHSTVEPAEKEFDADGKWFDRWDWVMDEMIWAFERISKQDEDEYYFADGRKLDHAKLQEFENRMQRALILFGKYFRHLWD